MSIQIEHTRNFHELAKLNESVQNWHHEHYPDEFKPFHIEEVEGSLENLFENDNVFSFVARLNDRPIGYLLGYKKTRPESAFQYEKTVLYIDQIVVVKENQKSGVGQLLLNAAYAFAKSEQIKEIQLDFWLGNKQAEDFFFSNGFESFNHKMKKKL